MGHMRPLLDYRREFPILDRCAYLITNSLGAMPLAAEEALLEYAHAWKTEGVRAWQHWWDLPRESGALIEKIIGAAPDTVSIHNNVTTAHAVVASCFDFTGKRNKVVYCDMNFPSTTYLYSAHERFGARIQTVASRDGICVDLQELLDAIDDETLLVPVSHVLFRSAFIQDAKAIANKCHKVGAHLVLDTYQSAGTVPVDVDAWKVDFAVGGTLKWLCGGPGVAFLYVRPDLAPTLNPSFTGWTADARPFDFVVNEHEYADGAYKFMNGTPNVPSI
jgi:kynureninase